MIVLSLLGCLLVGAGFAWLLYRNTDHLDQRLRYGLFAVRTLVVATILALLFFPLVRSISYQLEKPVIVIAQDYSMSVGHIKPVGFNHQQYETDIRKLAEDLSEQYEVRTFHFADSIHKGFNFSYTGKLTNVSDLIARLNMDLSGRNVGAVILATDGLFNRGGSPLYELGKLKAPIYTIGLGDTVSKKDLAVVNVSHNNLVYLDNEFILDVQIQALESKASRSILSVFENGRKVSEQQVEISSAAFSKSIPVKLKASKLGTHRYTIQLSQVSGEASEKNNSWQTYIEVIDARQKILIAADAPHPDIAALKHAIASNKHFEVDVMLAENLEMLNPSLYDLIVLYQLPSQAGLSMGFINKLSQSKTSLWYIIGAQTDLAAFNRLQSGVSFQGNNYTLQEAYSDVDPGFTTFNVDQALISMVAQFDPLQAPSGRFKVPANASIVLKQRVGKVQISSAQLFFVNNDGRKVGYLMGEGIWRWRLSEARKVSEAPVFGSLISNVVQYLSVKDDKRKFRATPSKNTFDENEGVILNAVLYNDAYVPVNTPDVNLQIRNEQGKSYNYLFSRKDASYELHAGALPPGNYSYTAATTLGGKKYATEGRFYVNTLIAEYQQTIANHQLLNNMAMQTKGKLYMPQRLSEIGKDIRSNEDIKTLSYEDRRYEEAINYKWLFAMLITLLTLEWFFRKRNGEI